MRAKGSEMCPPDSDRQVTQSSRAIRLRRVWDSGPLLAMDTSMIRRPRHDVAALRTVVWPCRSDLLERILEMDSVGPHAASPIQGHGTARPSTNRYPRSAFRASSWLWVAMTNATRSDACSWTKRSQINSLVLGSRLPVGSSASITRG